MEVIKFNKFMNGTYNKQPLARKELYHYETFTILAEILLVVAAVVFPVITVLGGGIPLPFGIPSEVIHAFIDIIS